MSLKEILRKSLKEGVGVEEVKCFDGNIASLKKEEVKLFNQYYCDLLKQRDVNTEQIPKFFKNLPVDGSLLLRLREESRTEFLLAKNKSLIEYDDLEALKRLLDDYASPPIKNGKLMINYESFLKVKDLAGGHFMQYFSPQIFSKLQDGDPYGRIQIMLFFDYVVKKAWLQRTRISLSLNDTKGQGYLDEENLEKYITELIPSLSQLSKVEESFHSFYICTAVRKFVFFLDPLRTGRIKIPDILACGFLDDLSELRDDETGEGNWFSSSSALHVYGQYLNLDKDRDGLLSEEELARYGTYTKVFIKRVFQEYSTYNGSMDYRNFLDFVLALENRREPQALQYLFRVLDIDHKGYINGFVLNYFFRSIQDLFQDHSEELMEFEPFKTEIFDMVKPEVDDCITLKDLIKCGRGDTVVSILIDFKGFLTHVNKDS